MRFGRRRRGRLQFGRHRRDRASHNHNITVTFQFDWALNDDRLLVTLIVGDERFLSVNATIAFRDKDTIITVDEEHGCGSGIWRRK